MRGWIFALLLLTGCAGGNARLSEIIFTLGAKDGSYDQTLSSGNVTTLDTRDDDLDTSGGFNSRTKEEPTLFGSVSFVVAFGGPEVPQVFRPSAEPPAQLYTEPDFTPSSPILGNKGGIPADINMSNFSGPSGPSGPQTFDGGSKSPEPGHTVIKGPVGSALSWYKSLDLGHAILATILLSLVAWWYREPLRRCIPGLGGGKRKKRNG